MAYSYRLGSQPVISLSSVPITEPNDWTRPSDWLPVPVTGSQEFAGLMAVFTQSGNFFALSATTATGSNTGSYIVDWGNGNSVVTNSAAIVYYSHSYDNLSSSTYCSRGYRQAWVRVTPSGSANLTNVNLQIQSNQIGYNQTGSTNWLDLIVGTPNLTTFLLGGTSVIHHMVERVTINSISSSLTDFGGKCRGFYRLRQFDVNANISNVTTFSSLFYNCMSLRKVPDLNTSKGTLFDGMFSNCYSLTNAPNLNMQSASNVSSIFYGNNSLTYVPLYNTAKVTNFTDMFRNSPAIVEIPPFNTSSGSIMGGMFSSCNSLKFIPQLDTSKATYLSELFASCYSLEAIPLLNCAKSTAFDTFAANCQALKTVELMNVTASTDFTNMFQNCTSLIKGALSGSSRTISYASCSLGRNEILDVFNNLGSGSFGQSITMSGNWGVVDIVPADTASIQAKGWKVML